MAEDPAADGLPEERSQPSEAPLGGPASRIFRYLPDGDPKDRAQRYLGDPDPKERAQRYLTESQVRKLPSGVRPADATPAPAPEPEPRLGNPAQSALHSMVAAVLEERRVEPVAEPAPPAAFVAPAPVMPAEVPARAPAAPVPTAPAEPVLYDEHGPATPVPADAVAAPAQPGDHLVRLRELADRLRTAAVSPDGLQPVVDLVRDAVGADAVVLALTVPRREQVTAGTTLGGGPRHAVPIRVDAANVGELMACRLTDAQQFSRADEILLSLVADQIGALVARAAAGSALEPGDQQFVNTLVGEMRAPLGTVAGMLEDFAAGNAGDLSESQHGYLAVAAEQTGRLLAIIRDLQTLSSLRRPEPHEMDHIGVGPLLERTAARSAPVAQERGIEVVVEPPQEALVVRGVPELLDRAVSAVVDNAVKYSRDGGRVTLAAELKDGTVRVTVTDEGIGMDPTDTAEVFERFVRARTALDAGIPGVGLGLTIVKEVVDVHSGRAWAESAIGHGTRVHMALPGVA